MSIKKLLALLLGIASATIITPYVIRFFAWILEPDYVRCNAGRIEA
jgi:hypothetical protein